MGGKSIVEVWYISTSFEKKQNRRSRTHFKLVRSRYNFFTLETFNFSVVLRVEQMGNIVSLIPIFYRSSIFQIILLASPRGGR